MPDAGKMIWAINREQCFEIPSRGTITGMLRCHGFCCRLLCCGQFPSQNQLKTSVIFHTRGSGHPFDFVKQWNTERFVYNSLFPFSPHHTPLSHLLQVGTRMLYIIYYAQKIIPSFSLCVRGYLESCTIWLWQAQTNTFINFNGVIKNMTKDFVGVLIEESLEEKGVLNKIKILKTKIEKVTERHKTPWIKQWTLHTVKILENRAYAVAKDLSKSLDSQHA